MDATTTNNSDDKEPPKTPPTIRKVLKKSSATLPLDDNNEAASSSSFSKSPRRRSSRSKSPGRLKSKKLLPAADDDNSRSMGKKSKSAGKLSQLDPISPNPKKNKSLGKRSKSVGRLRQQQASGDPKSPGGKSPKSPGKQKQRRRDSQKRPTWWALEHEETKGQLEEREQEEAGMERAMGERKRHDDLSKLRQRQQQEQHNSIQKGMVAQRLQEAIRQRELNEGGGGTSTNNKPLVMKNIRAKPLKLDVSKFEAPSYKKDSEQKSLAKETATKNFILKDFATMGAKMDIKRLVKAFESVEVKQGKKIVKQGEEGKHLYVVEHGAVEFKVDNVTVGTASVGATFGEHNLLFQQAEKATVVAASDGKEPTKLLRLHQETFRGIMQTTEENKTPPKIQPVAEKESWLETSKILQEREATTKALKKHAGPDDLERIKILGEGQFGEVWLVAANLPGVAVPKGQDRHEFALKIQHKEDDMEKAIRSEIEAMENLVHPFIATIYHTYEDETTLDMLLGLIPGGELWNVVHKEIEETGEWLSGIPETHAKFYGLVVADTLAFMHGQQYIYRDLKPENIMIDAKGYPIIVDFGFAKQCPHQTFTFCGTPNYVAPEIIKNSGHNEAVDYWALGIVIYEMISGENPFYYDGLDEMALFQAVCEEDGEPLKEKFSKSVGDLVDKLLVKDPTKRLGMLEGKAQDIFDHGWFDGLDLHKLRSKKIKGPWIPGEDNTQEDEAEAARQKQMEEEEELRRREVEEEKLRQAKEQEQMRREQQQEQERERLGQMELENQRAAEELRKQQEFEEEEEQRKMELENQKAEKELRKQKKELEEQERRKMELENQRAAEELQKQKEFEEQEQKERDEEELRQQMELEKESEEEELRKQEEIEEQRKREEEEEEERRQKLELEKEREEKKLRKQKESEEQQRKKRKAEKKRRRQLELEKQKEEEKLRKQKELEEEEEEQKEHHRQLDLEKQRKIKKNKAEESRKQEAEEAEAEEELSLDSLIEESEPRNRNAASMNQSWGELVSPVRDKTRKSVLGTGPVPEGIVARLINEQGQSISSPDLLSPLKVQAELKKSVRKGLVAQRLSIARENEKMGASAPSMFSSFEL